MAFVHSYKENFPGFATPTVYLSRIGVTTNVGTTSITVPSTGSIAPTIRSGVLRVKSNTIGVNATFLVVSLLGTDGVTTVELMNRNATATAAGDAIDVNMEFFTDLSLTSVTVAVTVATANSTVDVELIGQV